MWRAVILWLLSSLPAAALECRNLTYLSNRYTVCEADLARDALRLWHLDDEGQVIGSFARLKAHLAPQGKQLIFAMNAGMYHDNRAPVGHYVEDGRETMRVVTTDGPGNFGLLPNGVFCIEKDRARVMESRRFAKTRPACTYATQSGPMLVIDGALHPRFIETSTSRYIRNGVGVSKDGTRVVFAISNNVVNFHSFARLFRDALDVPNALYFDGKVSRLHAPALRRSDVGFPMGPIVGVALGD